MKTSIVDIRLTRLGALVLQNESYRAVETRSFVSKLCTRLTRDPSNSVPYYVVIVIGEKDFQIMFSQILVAMNSEIPLPKPYPLLSMSSRSNTTIPANTSCPKINRQFPNPIVLTSPYYPLQIYANASHIDIIKPNTIHSKTTIGFYIKKQQALNDVVVRF